MPEYDFQDRSQSCKDCPLLNASRFVEGKGDPECPVFVVGTAPGEKEVEQGQSFVGPAGTMLTEVLDSMGVEVYMTNILKRRPQGTPTRAQCWRCGNHLVEELGNAKAKVVLTLGAAPWKFIHGISMFPEYKGRTKNPPLGEVHGLPIPMTRFGNDLCVVPTYDPANVLREGGLLSKKGNTFLQDLEDFQSVVRSVL